MKNLTGMMIIAGVLICGAAGCGQAGKDPVTRDEKGRPVDKKGKPIRSPALRKLEPPPQVKQTPASPARRP